MIFKQLNDNISRYILRREYNYSHTFLWNLKITNRNKIKALTQIKKKSELTNMKNKLKNDEWLYHACVKLLTLHFYADNLTSTCKIKRTVKAIKYESVSYFLCMEPTFIYNINCFVRCISFSFYYSALVEIVSMHISIIWYMLSLLRWQHLNNTEININDYKMSLS